ncbi:hypothetical protein Z043_120503 [Scleropages formosus]|uniref:Major facilitator superfamily (MFS) profile domain-containing protein n=1 Tax=Scleropages formosus TaxID=113540 RepID=A0A0P7TUR8_SCLFO|nr:hypothetical protein Z043_120503 [Scleropages formosus]
MFLACQALTIYTHTTPCPSINITHSQLHTPFSILQSHGVQQSPPFDPITVIPLLSTMEAYGLFVPFLFFSVVAVINILFTALCVPETKGRSLEEIENYFRTGRKFTINQS